MNEQELVEQARTIVKKMDASKSDILYAEYNAIVDELEALRKPPNCPFSLLPTELIHKVFEIFVENEGSPFLLSCVCKQWRTLAHHYPNLWTLITINTTVPSWYDVFEIMSTRSLDRLLDITLHFPLPPKDVQQIIDRQNLDRWRSLVIRKGQSSTGPWRFPLRLADPSVLVQLLSSHSFPNLREIDVKTISVNSRSPFLWSNYFLDRQFIESLSESPRAMLLSHLTVNLYWTGMDQVLQVLRDTPDLTYLKLATQRHPGEPTTQPNNRELIPLHKLRHLRMENDGMNVLLSIECPAMETLKGSMPSEQLPELYSRLCTFKKLRVLSITITGPNTPVQAHSPDSSQDGSIDSSPSIELDELTVTCQASTVPYDHIYTLFALFRKSRTVTLLTDQDFDWPQATRTFSETIESLTIEQHLRTANVNFNPPGISPLCLYPRLKSLSIESKVCNSILSSIVAPELRGFTLIRAKDLTLDTVVAFLLRSPGLRSMRMEGVNMAPASLPTTLPAPFSIQEIQTTHEDAPILQALPLPDLRTLRLAGVLQGRTVQRTIYHFDQREIHLSAFSTLPQSLIESLTTLDLCVANVLFPTVLGLVEILPLLTSLESISLPRALNKADVLIDLLVQSMHDTIEGQNILVCHRLKHVHTEDYPEWEGLLALLANRNRTAHISAEDKKGLPSPLESLSLVRRPHPSILTRVQSAMAGKFPPPPSVQSAV